MRKLVRYLQRHPMVWIVPVFFLTIVLGVLAWKLSANRAPDVPFIYEID